MKNPFFIVVLFFASCNSNYVSEVKESSQKIFSEKKKFFVEVSFYGTVMNKEHCKKCQVNSYVLFIEIQDTTNKQISFSDSSYVPYYQFLKNNKILELSVTKQIYNYVKKGADIRKAACSGSLNINGREMVLIDTSIKYNWFKK